MENRKVMLFESWVASEYDLPEVNIYAPDKNKIDFTQKLIGSMLIKEDILPEEYMVLSVLKESNLAFDDWSTLNESFGGMLKAFAKKVADKAKDGGEMVKKIAGDAQEWVKSEIQGLPDFFNAIKNGVKGLINMISSFFKMAYDATIGKAVEWVKSKTGKSENEIKAEIEKADPSVLKKEAEGIGDLATGYKKAVTGLFTKEVSSGVQQAENEVDDIKSKELLVSESVEDAVMGAMLEAVNDSSMLEIREAFKHINGDTLNEAGVKIPFVSKISARLEKFPPFSWLHKLAEYIKANANDALNKISEVSAEKKIIAQSSKFIVIGALIGLILEDLIKGLAKNAITTLIPPLYGIITILGTIAGAIWIVHIASTVIQGLMPVK